MASGGSSSRGGSGGRTFDFGSDDVLCSYDDFGPQDPPNGRRSDPSAKDLHESRTGRSSVNFHGQENLSKDDVISAVEKCMKKYADNLLRFLEGISGRLSQLEVYCYKLERSIGEFRTDLTRDQSESDHKLNSLEKHLQEVHRSVQILRDKQELAETQKELAKLQLVRKESSSPSFSKRNEEGAPPSASETKQHDDSDNIPNQKLALALPHQLPPTSLPTRTSEQSQPYKEPALQQPATTPPLNMQQDRYTMNQPSTYYPPQMQPEYQYLQPRPQMQDPSAQVPQQQSQVINQPQPNQLPPQYQPQWTSQPPQHAPQQMVQQQPTASQAQIRTQTPPSYPPYLPNQPAIQMLQTFPRGSNPGQVPYSATPAPSTNHPEAMPFVYKGSGSSVSQPPQQQVQHIQRQPQSETNQSSFQQNLNKGGYMSATTPYAPVTPQNPQNQSYNSMFSIDGSRGSHSQIFPTGNYPSANMSAPHNQQLPPSGGNFHHPGAQIIRGHPFGEMIEKAVNMGYSRDHILSVIHRMGEAGQPIDFNALLDGLNTHATGGASPRVWSG